jgi:dihydroorotase
VNGRVAIVGGTVITPTGPVRFDVLVEEGVIVAVGSGFDTAGALVLDATDCWVGPAFVDLHAHLREPGASGAETIASGARAAAVGGYGAIVAMPNTDPPIDDPVVARYVLSAAKDAVVAVAVAGAITVGRRGEHLAPMAELAALGVRLFTDDGSGVQDAALMRRALAYAAPLGVRLAQHCEEAALAGAGVMNEGALSSRLGLAGRPALAEELMVYRDLRLVELTGGALHFLHLSTAGSLELVKDAKARGLPVTAEVAPHHFTLDESACAEFDPIFKVHPPLRSAADVAALCAALRAGDVDAVATDHAPHPPEQKDLPFDEAPAGMLGLEHAASLTLAALGTDDPVRFFSLLSRRPATIAQLTAVDHAPQGAHGGDVAVGEAATIVAFDPTTTHVVDRATLQSRSANTPYHGRTLTGRARHLVVAGRPIVTDGALA